MLSKLNEFLANGNWLSSSMEYYIAIKEDGCEGDNGGETSYK